MAEPFSLVTVGLTNPKGVAQTYQAEIASKIDEELSRAAEVETEILSTRKEASAKIYAYWLEKKS